MINIGIVGYGNVGKAVEKQLKNNKNFNLVAIFSKKTTEKTENIDKILNFKNKIDLLFLCVGSQSDLESLANKLIRNFSIIDCYDNHSKLRNYINEMNNLAKKHKKIALCCLGWDPGIFSLMRGLYTSLDIEPFTFWGKGTSQGHTQAIKQINGVIDAIQFTIPNQELISKIKLGEIVENKNFHSRQCFVVCEQKDEKKIENEIKNMPNYFKGYNTTVSFISQEQLNNIKTLSHKGEIVSKNNIINFSLNLESNPDFTAKILLTFAKSYKKLNDLKNFGSFTIFDIPMKYLIDDYFNIL